MCASEKSAEPTNKKNMPEHAIIVSLKLILNTFQVNNHMFRQIVVIMKLKAAILDITGQIIKMLHFHTI